MKPLGLIMCGIGSSNFQMGFNPVQSYLGDIVVIRTPTTPSTTVVGTPLRVNTKLPKFSNHRVRKKNQSTISNIKAFCFVLFEWKPSKRKEMGIPAVILPHVRELYKCSYFLRLVQS